MAFPFTPIQVILLCFLVLIFLTALSSSASLLTRRLMAAALLILAIITVVFHESTNKVANILGVGRGADLILYVSFLLFIYLHLLQDRKIQKLRSDVTRLTRAMAALPINEPVERIDPTSEKD